MPLRPNTVFDMHGTAIYSQLTKDGEFRLLELQPGENDQIIKCELAHYSLDNHPEYAAVSYEWAPHFGSTLISCNFQHVSVTNNLYGALKSLRLSGKPRTLWIDALCINQADEEEKSRQVSIMQNIYGSASKVLIWLGKETQLVQAAFEVMDSLALLWLDRTLKGVNETNYLTARILQRPDRTSVFETIESHIHFSHDLNPYLLHRKPERPDDEIFQFHDAGIWQTIDDIFCNTYFQRCWIVQEVAVCNVPYVVCGSRQMPWDVFRNAHYGRRLIGFDAHARRTSYEEGPLTCVEDARKRFRDPTSKTDLASALATFTYAHQSRQQDRVYAAMGLVKVGNTITPDYTKTVQQVFLDAATCIIKDRKDLYLFGNKTLYLKRTMTGIPSWVPEWTGPTTESATEHYSVNLSQCLNGKLEVQGRSLFVNAISLGFIKQIYPIANDIMILQAFVGIQQELAKMGKSLFDAYVGQHQDHSTPVRTKFSKDLWADNLGQAFALITRLPKVPQLLLEILSPLGRFNPHRLDSTTLNIESLWSAMIPHSRLRPQTEIPICEKLFLATQITLAWRLESKTGAISTAGLPKGYGPWMMAATLITHTDIFLTPAFQEMYRTHALRSDTEDECVFITSSGYFGRAPHPGISRGQMVAILGGGFVPYVLERHGDHYKLMSHAYVNGIMHWRDRPDGMPVERVEIQ